MAETSRTFELALAAALAVLACGCASSGPVRSAPPATAISTRVPASQPEVAAPSVRQASHQETDAAPQPPADVPQWAAHPSPEVLPPPQVGDGLFAGQASLVPEQLIALVHQRNPTLQAMVAQWQAAAARYPQEVSLDDPMLDVMAAPASFGPTSNVPESWSVELSQKLPWHGKRALRGQIASAGANASAWDAEDTRVQLALAARLALADYLLAENSLGLALQEQDLLKRSQAIARIKYETNQAAQQDLLQANVELADIQRRLVEATRAKRVAAARINTLLHREPHAWLPPLADADAGGAEFAGLDELLNQALWQRPDLAALSSRIAAEQAAYCLAVREFKPDLELYGRYDEYWLDFEQRASVGLKLNLPVQRDRRRAAVNEAQAKISRAQAEYEARVAQIRYDVLAAHERLFETRETLRLYRDEILKAAELNADSARAAYEAGTTSFLTLVTAQRQLILFRQKQAEAAAEYQRQLAELERAVGVPLVMRPAR